MSEPTAPKPDIRFAVTITKDTHDSFGDGYRHFRATACVLGVDKYGSTGRPELLSPTDYSVPSTAKPLAGLQITAQSDSDSMKRPGDEWYAWQVEYGRHTVKLADAEEMLPVLRKISKRIDKLTVEMGYPSTLAQFCTYAVKALTSERQPFMRKVPDGQDYEGTGYRSMDANALSYHLQSDAQEWRKNHDIDPS